MYNAIQIKKQCFCQADESARQRSCSALSSCTRRFRRRFSNWRTAFYLITFGSKQIALKAFHGLINFSGLCTSFNVGNRQALVCHWRLSPSLYWFSISVRTMMVIFQTERPTKAKAETNLNQSSLGERAWTEQKSNRQNKSNQAEQWFILFKLSTASWVR